MGIKKSLVAMFCYKGRMLPALVTSGLGMRAFRPAKHLSRQLIRKRRDKSHCWGFRKFSDIEPPWDVSKTPLRRGAKTTGEVQPAPRWNQSFIPLYDKGFKLSAPIITNYTSLSSSLKYCLIINHNS